MPASENSQHTEAHKTYANLYAAWDRTTHLFPSPQNIT